MYGIALIVLIPFIRVFISYHDFVDCIERWAINISHRLIYTYSALQLMCKPYISVYKDCSNYCMIGLVDDNYEAYKTTMKLPVGFCRADYLFNVCQYVDDENITLCKLNYNKQFSFHFEKTNPSVHFILVELIVNGTGHKLDLKTDNYSYYVVGNFFGLSYFRYMANDRFGAGFIKNTDHLELKIIDRDINTHQFSLKGDEDGILLHKDKYIIIQKESSDYLTQEQEQQEKKDDDEVDSQSSSEKWMDDI
jgi:hypothetical protein